LLAQLLLFTFEDNRQNYGEQRWVTLGLFGLRVVIIIHRESEDKIRIISMREANNNEQSLFFRNL
jgi:uncharacterized DUF497 family protein